MMATSTPQHMRAACWTSDHTAVSFEWWQELFDAGAKVAILQLQDARDEAGQWVPVPRSYVDRLKAQGWRVGCAVRPSGNPLSNGRWEPEQTADWTSAECKRLALNGIAEFNFEDEVQKADLGEWPGWSRQFNTRWRSLRPTMPSQLVTYPVEGLDHAPYIAANFRVSVETFSPTNLWEWSPSWIVNWCKRIGWQKGRIKVCYPVHTIDGFRSPIAKTVTEATLAGAIGGTLYPINQAMPPEDYLVPLVRELIRTGGAR